MIYIYFELVKASKRTIKQVPTHLREEVQMLIDHDAGLPVFQKVGE